MTSLHMRLTVFLACLLAALLLTASVCAEDAQRMLLNGSFEYLDSYDPDDPDTHAGISIDEKRGTLSSTRASKHKKSGPGRPRRPNTKLNCSGRTRAYISRT